MIPKRIRSIAGASFIALTLLAGCGGGGGASSTPPAGPTAGTTNTGSLTVTVTDAEGDFVAYIVDVTSLRLRRANGATVETLPLTTRVDFTQLTDVSELLTVATVPAGVYEEVVATLDYTAAEVVVQGEQGEPLPARVVDIEGNPVTTIDVTLALQGDNVIRITPATVRALSLDFDLDASNTIDTTTAPPTVTLEPILLAMPVLEAEREHRVRGQLADVDPAADQVTLDVRPFRHRTGPFGRFTFTVADTTRFEIDGVEYLGAEGLAAMDALSVNTPVVALGDIVERELVAREVVAGSSVYWAGTDAVHGVVTARNADSLTLRGVTLEREDGRYQFRNAVTVLVGDETLVSAAGLDGADLDQLSISVGQRIRAAGALNDDATLDARAGRVRMLVNRAFGEVVVADPLVLDLKLLNGLRPVVFDFTGTGATTADDADPQAYEIDTGGLGLLTLEPADPVQVRGLVNRFGFAPPDYLARTVVEAADAARGATAHVAWRDGSATPFVATTPSGIEFDLSDARSRLILAGRLRELPIEPDRLVLTGPEDGLGAYVVAERSGATITVYREFAAAVDAMNALLADGGRLHRLTAHGRYTEDSGQLTTVRASFVFETTDSGAGAGG